MLIAGNPFFQIPVAAGSGGSGSVEVPQEVLDRVTRLEILRAIDHDAASQGLPGGYDWSFDSDILPLASGATYDADGDCYTNGEVELFSIVGSTGATYGFGNNAVHTFAKGVFTADTTGLFSQLGVKLRELGTLSDQAFQISIQTQSGGVPTGTKIAESGILNSDDMTYGTLAFIEFATPGVVTAGVTYSVVFEWLGTIDGTNYMEIWGWSDNPEASGAAGYSQYETSGWTDYGGGDLWLVGRKDITAMTLPSPAIPAAVRPGASPDDAALYVLHRADGAAVKGTDLVARISRDGTVSYCTASVADDWSVVVEDFITIDGELYDLLRCDLALDGSAGTDLRWEITTTDTYAQAVAERSALRWG